MVKKRVRCLFRVSTLKQVEENDIPMQRTSCMEFIKKKDDWIFDNEYVELGVSGYRLSESKRDVLQDIKRDVLKKEFDILLVFMFDRIGRRDEETPFVVEWLIKQGIEVWSVKEGQRKIENRVDKLINYLTYWQAGGESEKTSIRVKEIQLQMAENGILTYGGTRNAPYGYTFIKSDKLTRKGVIRQKLIINIEESKIVTEIFNLYTKMGYGAGKIAKILNDRKIKPRRSKLWSVSSIIRILENPIYMGYPAYNKKTTIGEVTSRRLPFEEWILPKHRIDELVIVSEKTWYRAKEIRESRRNNLPSSNIMYNKPKQTKSKLLLIGMIKCGECGFAMSTSCSKKVKKNGEISNHLYYRCSSTRANNECGLTHKSYKKDYIEKIVLKNIYNFMDKVEKTDLSKLKNKRIKDLTSSEEHELKNCISNISDIEKNIDILKKEVVKSLMGESEFTSDLLNELIEDKQNELKQLLEHKSAIETSIAKKSIGINDLQKFKELIPIWKKEFDNADVEFKKMLLTEIIKEVRIYNNKIEIDIRFEFNDYIINNDKYSKIIENTVIIEN